MGCVVRWRWGHATRRRGAVTMRKHETSRNDRISPSSSSAVRSHRCDLQRSPTRTSDVHWGKMGANQSTRSAPTPGEEGNTRSSLREGKHTNLLWASGTLRGNTEDWLSVTRARTYIANLIFYEVTERMGAALDFKHFRKGMIWLSNLLVILVTCKSFLFITKARTHKVTSRSSNE